MANQLYKLQEHLSGYLNLLQKRIEKSIACGPPLCEFIRDLERP